MPPQKRHSAARRSTKAHTIKTPKRTQRRRTKTQALAVADAVRREPLAKTRLANQLAALEPLRRTILDRQIALLDLAMTWSPVHIIVDQQAAFWVGFTHDGVEGGHRRKPARNRAKPKSRKAH